MTLIRKLLNGGLNTDVEARMLAPDDYRHGLNIRTAGAEDDDMGSVVKVKGNTLGTPSLAPFEDGAITIGAFNDLKNNRIIYMDWSPTKAHRIYEYDTANDTHTLILQSEFLNFQKNYYIWHINLVDDNLLYWIDNFNEPRKVNIDRAKSNGYPSPFTEQYINVIQTPPPYPPKATYAQDVLKRANNLTENIYQFKYRYIYVDNDISAYSPISKVPVRAWYDVPDPNANRVVYTPEYFGNVINVVIKTGDETVKEIEIVARVSNSVYGNEASGDFFLIGTLTKSDLPNPTHTFKFYNDAIHTSVELNESNKIHNHVPIKAAAQEIIDNRLCYVNITEGYDVEDYDISLKPIFNKEEKTDQVFEGAGFISYGTVRTDFIGNVTASLLFHLEITFGAKTFSYYIEVEPNQLTGVQVIAFFVSAINSDPSRANLFYANPITSNRFNIDKIGVGNLTVTGNRFLIPLKSYKKGAEHSFGILYTDHSGRRTSVQSDDNSRVFIPFYNEISTGNKGTVHMEMTINHLPPSFATHYQIAYTKNQTVGRFIQILAGNVASLGFDRYTVSLSQIPRYNTHSAKSQLSYDFTQGDRFRVFFTDGAFVEILEDTEVLSYDSSTNEITVIIRGLNAISLANAFFEIYTPQKDLEKDVFFEIGECFEIKNGFHLGSSQNQTSSQPAIVLIKGGDIYVRDRILFDFTNNLIVSSIAIETRLQSDFMPSSHADEGRPAIIDHSYKRINRSVTAYISEIFIPESNINGLSSFFGFAFPSTPSRAKDYDKNFGSVQRIYAEDKRLIIFQELKTGAVLVNESVTYDQTGVPTINKSNEILSDIIYYKGEFGIGKYPGSFAVYGHAKYFADPKRGAVLRLSQDGITEISEYGMHNHFTDTFRDVLKETAFLLAVYDAKFQEYILVIQKSKITNENIIGNFVSGSSNNYTISFPSNTDLSNFSNGGTVTITFFNNKGIKYTDTVTILLIFTDTITIETNSLLLEFLVADLTEITFLFTKDTIISSKTIAFNERINKWTTFYSFQPEFMISSDTDIATFKDGKLWRHNVGDYCNFYGIQYDSEITFIANEQPADTKFWLALEQQTDKVWQMVEATNQLGQKTSLETTDFENIEGVFWSDILKDENTPVTNPIIEGDDMRSPELTIKLKHSGGEFSKLFSVGIRHELSERTNK